MAECRNREPHRAHDLWGGGWCAGRAETVPETNRMRALAATCTCGTPGLDYEGPQADCPVHGAIRALNEAHAEIEGLRAERDALKAELAEARAVEQAARNFAEEMRSYCSPHGVAADYANRLTERLDAARQEVRK